MYTEKDGEPMSENAAGAFQCGLETASSLFKKYRISKDTVEKFCRSIEWHHVGENCNAVDFYDISKETIDAMLQHEKQRRENSKSKAKAQFWLKTFEGFFYFSTQDNCNKFITAYVSLNSNDKRFTPIEKMPTKKESKKAYDGDNALIQFLKWI